MGAREFFRLSDGTKLPLTMLLVTFLCLAIGIQGLVIARSYSKFFDSTIALL